MLALLTVDTDFSDVTAPYLLRNARLLSVRS